MKKHSGSCLCGAVTFSFEADALDDVWFCHCSQCRKNYGMYGAFVGVPRDDLKLEGAGHLKSYKASEERTRTFCDVCGSSITWQGRNLERVYLLLGLLDGDAHITGGQHIFVEDKGDYYDICDSLPQHDTAPD